MIVRSDCPWSSSTVAAFSCLLWPSFPPGADPACSHLNGGPGVKVVERGLGNCLVGTDKVLGGSTCLPVGSSVFFSELLLLVVSTSLLVDWNGIGFCVVADISEFAFLRLDIASLDPHLGHPTSEEVGEGSEFSLLVVVVVFSFIFQTSSSEAFP